MEYIIWRYRKLSAIAHTTWWRPKHGGDGMLAGYVSEIYIYYGSRAVLFLYINDLFFSLSRENNIKGFSVFIGVFS